MQTLTSVLAFVYKETEKGLSYLLLSEKSLGKDLLWRTFSCLPEDVDAKIGFIHSTLKKDLGIKKTILVKGPLYSFRTNVSEDQIITNFVYAIQVPSETVVKLGVESTDYLWLSAEDVFELLPDTDDYHNSLWFVNAYALSRSK